MKTIKTANQWLLRGIAGLLIFLILTMLILGFGQVVLRKFFNRGYSDINLFLQFLVLWIAFLGATLATDRQKHIKIDALTQVFPGWLNRWLAVAVNGTGLALCAVLSKAGLTFFYDFSVSEWGWGDNPVWYVSFLVGFGLLAVEFAFQLLEALFPKRKEDASAVGTR